MKIREYTTMYMNNNGNKFRNEVSPLAHKICGKTYIPIDTKGNFREA